MYAKVFKSLFDGSMRGKPNLILVFINILCHCDQEGIADVHWRVISDETGLDAETVLASIKELESPDKESRTRTDAGIRIKRIDLDRNWGWEIVNFKAYNQLKSAKERREYMRKYMQDKRKERSVNTSKQPLAKLTDIPIDLPLSVDKNIISNKDVCESWNKIAKENGLREIKRLGKNRLKHYKARIKEFPDFWQTLNREIPLLSDFAKGNNDNGWKIDFDYCVTSEDKHIKLSEGFFRKRETKKPEAPISKEPEMFRAWECPYCEKLNTRNPTHCDHCKKKKPIWRCPACKHLNVEDKANCEKCKKARPMRNK